LPASTSRFTRAATIRIRSVPAIDVPPNFMTILAMGFLVQAVKKDRLKSAALLGEGHGEGK
jgi:hypothetical protein